LAEAGRYAKSNKDVEQLRVILQLLSLSRSCYT